MPYIKQENRKKFDDLIIPLADELETNGDLNYCIYQLCKLWLTYREVSYDSLSDCIKTLECAKLEFYRMILEPYEDQKIKENGNVTPIFDFEKE